MVIGLLLSYLLGSIPTAFLVGKKIKGIDIRQYGSGNVGATNVFRVVGRKWGIGVLVFDLFKGFIVAGWLPRFFVTSGAERFTAGLLFGIAAILGHTWSVWLKFRGGKGVATSAGVAMALVPLAASITVLTWVLIFTFTRYVSLASLIAACVFPLGVILLYRAAPFFATFLPICLGLTLFIFYTHRENIKRLKEGTEKRLI